MSAEHVEFDALAVAFGLGVLDTADRGRFCAHALGCVDCAVTVDETRRIAAGLAVLVDRVEPPPELGAAISAAVRVEPRTAASEPGRGAGVVHITTAPGRGHRRRGARGTDGPGTSPARGRGSRLVAAVAAAAVVVALAGFGVVAARRASDRGATIAEQRRVLALLATPGARTLTLAAAAGEHGTARLVLAEGRAWVLTDGLAPNAGSTTYVLWGLRGATPTGLATFDVHAQGLDVVDAGPLTAGVTTTPAFAVSVEPGRTIPAKPSHVVLASA